MELRAGQNALQSSVMDVPRLPFKKNRVYTFTIKSIPGIQLADIATGTGFALFGTLGSLNNSTAYTTIFDSYRILQLTTSFIPVATAFGSGTTVSHGALLTAIDYDDANAPSTSADLVNYDSCQIDRVGNFVERTYNPKVAAAVYSGAFTSFAQSSLWIDCASPNVQHYGLKYFIEPSTGSTSPTWDIHATYVIQFKNPRG